MNTPAQILNAFYEFKELFQRKRVSSKAAFVAGARFGESKFAAESHRLNWLDRHRTAEHDSDASEHWVVAWVSQGEPGNEDGGSGRFVARAPTFRECIDKFMAGNIVRID